MKRDLEPLIQADLPRKVVLLVGPRQVGKTTLARRLGEAAGSATYLNWDIPLDRSVIQRQSWPQHTPLLVLDELHKMPDWKSWLKGVADGRPAGQQVLVTGSARMETFRQGGESLAGRYFSYRLDPLSVRECVSAGAWTDEDALGRLLVRGGFPEPFLVDDDIQAQRWRAQYLTDLIREDILEFSRVHELTTMRLFVEMLRDRVGSPLSLASLARDLAVSPTTLKRYLDILQALFIVFPVTPWHRNIARSVLQAPKVYFYDTGLVRGGDGPRFENAVATMLLKEAHWQADARGVPSALHYLRTKDGAEVDFALARDDQLATLVECKWSDDKPHRALMRFAQENPQAQAVQLVRELRQEQDVDGVRIRRAVGWLAQLNA
jgi:uncharacterized protein